MSLARMFAGRKKDSDVWRWFEYRADIDKSICLANSEKNEPCGVKLAGKNPTNLKNHLSRSHKKEHGELCELEKEKTKKPVEGSGSTTGQTQSQTLSDCLQRRIVTWPSDSREYQDRINNLLTMFTDTGSPVTLADNTSFRHLITALDPKFKMPASAKINTLLRDRMTVNVTKLRNVLTSSRRVTICLDGWSKKGLSASFLGISACFFNTVLDKPQHAFLNLVLLKHPHTGDMLSQCLENSLVQWGIPKEKILLIITDNGANMVKAVRLLGERTQMSGNTMETESESDEWSDDDTSSVGPEEEANHAIDDNDDMLDFSLLDSPYKRMGCMAHTIQLIVKKAYEGPYKEVLLKARALVGKVRKSSVITEKIVEKCGKIVISDNSTRWNSTYFMSKRLLEIRRELNEVLASMSIDSLQSADWAVVEELVGLLEPFAAHTDLLQSNALSISNIVPSMLDLECHLDEFPHAKILTTSMLVDLRRRCASLLQPNHSEFNPIPAAACLLDPSCSSFILGFERSVSELRDAAKAYIINKLHQAENMSPTTSIDSATADSEIPAVVEPPCKKFKFLLAKQRATNPSTTPTDSAQGELSKYLIEIRNATQSFPNPLDFWYQRRAVYPLLAPLAEDLVTAPASQAYVERIFSVCGLLTAGRRNRMKKNLEMRAFLKLNAHIFD